MSSTYSSRTSRPKAIPTIAIFARVPIAGRAKTRLIPLLGAQGAAALQWALILDTTAKVVRLGGRVARWMFAAGGKLTALPGPARWNFEAQRGRDLGERLDWAFRQLLRNHGRVVIIGTDSPLLTPRLLRLALSELNSCDAVLGPCPDGGFYLVGLSRSARGLFRDVRLGTRHAYRDVQRALLARGLSCSILPTIPDLDRPRDLQEFEQQAIRIPALRAAAPALWRFVGARRAVPPESTLEIGRARHAVPLRSTKPSKSSRRR